jgi:hypothetical protein
MGMSTGAPDIQKLPRNGCSHCSGLAYIIPRGASSYDACPHCAERAEFEWGVARRHDPSYFLSSNKEFTKMTVSFTGTALPLGQNDLHTAAANLHCDTPAIQAVTTVECGPGGGFLGDGSKRPIILFEAFRFAEATGHRYDSQYPNISSPTSNWKLYKGGAAEYDRLAQAMVLSASAALLSTSWGMFQIMGSNYKTAGFDTVDDFVNAMAVSAGNQLEAFVKFCQDNGLSTFLAAHDWTHFALRYNGALYARNQYDTRLAAAYQRAVEAAAGTAASAPLQIGDTGPGVKALQEALIAHGANIIADGSFGRATDYALMNFQAVHSIGVDGIAGPQTLVALGI